MEFRRLRADEIDCRVAQVNAKGVSLLLYKDARCDMNILDETVGAMNWQRSHSRENANCTVSIWDSEKKQWISKEDTGTESNTEALKGLASDSFKRACFNWGIGRELYTAPDMWIWDSSYVQQQNGKFKCYEKFHVKEIYYNDRSIQGLIVVDSRGKAFVFGKLQQDEKRPTPEEQHPVVNRRKAAAERAKKPADEPAYISKDELAELKAIMYMRKIPDSYIETTYKVTDLKNLTRRQYDNIIHFIDAITDICNPNYNTAEESAEGEQTA